MPSHGDLRDFDVVVIGAGTAGAGAAELGGALGYSVALVERDPAVRARQVSEHLWRTTLERIGERGVHLIHGEASPPGPGHFAPRHSLRRPVRRRLQDRHGESYAQARRDLIVSGGAIGIEYATIFFALGISVTILDAAPRLRAGAASWAPPRAGSSRSGRPAQTGLPRLHRSSAGRPRDRRDRLRRSPASARP